MAIPSGNEKITPVILLFLLWKNRWISDIMVTEI